MSGYLLNQYIGRYQLASGGREDESIMAPYMLLVVVGRACLVHATYIYAACGDPAVVHALVIVSAYIMY